MSRAIIGLGSNLARPGWQVQTALEALRAHPDVTALRASPRFRSAAVGPGPQPDYCNAVAEFETTLEARACLALLQGIEQRQGRRRDGPRWAARTLDLDLLEFGELICENEDLCLPHPRIRERAFVLQPWLALQPDGRLQPEGLPLREALERLQLPSLPLWVD